MAVPTGRAGLLERLERQFSDLSLRLERLEDLQTSELDAFYSFRCGLLGVRYYTDLPELDEQWESAQHALGATLRRERLSRRLGPDAYLLLLLLDETCRAQMAPAAREALFRRIQTSRSECIKKIATYSADGAIAGLDDLPFAPLPLPGATEEAGVAAVAGILESCGITGLLAEHLARTRPGAQAVAERIARQEYGPAPEVHEPVAGRPLPALTQSAADARAVPGRAASQPLRLGELALPNFRSFSPEPEASPASVDLSANITLVYGENGVGKTSLVQGLEWAISGTVADIADAAGQEEHDQISEALRNLCHRERPAEVALSLSDGTGLERKGDLFRSEVRGPTRDLDEFGAWREWLGVSRQPNEREDLVRPRAGRRLVLGQSQMRRLLTANSPRERLSDFAGLLGDLGSDRTGRKVSSVLEHLRAQRAQFAAEQERISQELAAVEAERAGLTESLDPAVAGLGAVAEAVRFLDETESASSASDAAVEAAPGEEALLSALDAAIDRLEACRQRSQASLRWLQERDLLREQIGAAETSIAHGRERLSQAEERRLAAAAEGDGLRRRTAAIDAEIAQRTDERLACAERIDSIEAWLARLPELHAVSGRLAHLSDRAAELHAQAAAVSEHLSAKEAELAALLVEDDGAALTEWLSAQAGRLDDLSEFIIANADVDLDLDATRARQGAAQDVAQRAQRELSEARERLGNAEGELRLAESELHRIAAEHDRRFAAVAELRELVGDHRCPLCSHGWESRDALLAAIDRHAGQPSLEQAQAISRRDSAERLVAEARSARDTAQRILGRAEQSAKGLAEDAAAAAAMLRTRRELATACHLPDGCTLEDVLQRRDSLVEELAVRRRHASQQDAARRELAGTALQVRRQREAINAEIAQTRHAQATSEAYLRELRDGAPRGLGPSADATELRRQRDSLGEEAAGLDAEMVAANDRRRELAAELVSVVAGVAFAEAEAEAAGSVVRREQERMAEFESQLRAMQSAPSEVAEGAEQPTDSFASALDEVERLLSRGRSLRAALAGTIAQRRVAQLDEQTEALRASYEGARAALAQSQNWDSALRTASDRLHTAQVQVVTNGLEPLRHMLRAVHRRLTLHPLFEDVDWEIGQEGLRFYARPRTAEGRPDLPESCIVQAYMNEAQQNLVALSAFLATALCRDGRLRLAVLDDPVQSMDELNIYALLDLVRVLSHHMQVIVTTGRSDLFHLARAKFLCLNAEGTTRFRAYRLNWDAALGTTRVEAV